VHGDRSRLSPSTRRTPATRSTPIFYCGAVEIIRPNQVWAMDIRFLTSSCMKVYCFYLNTARRILDEFAIDTYNVSSIEALKTTLKVIGEKVKRERERVTKNMLVVWRDIK
jgi:hypothetical protein